MMNNLLKDSFIAVLILLSGCSEHIYAQRCGGDLSYIVRNKKGEIIDAEKAGLKYIRTVIYKGEEPITNYGYPWKHIDSAKMLNIKTYCGMYLAEIALEYEGRMMLLRFHNIPAELNFYIDSVPFEEGIYEIDFKSDMELKGQTLNREGLRSKEGKYMLRAYAQAGRLVSAKNWKRTNSKRGRI
jgi:hypothetical protein